uniref:Transmembrane protein n=1 Tax=Rhizophora mucronata TaxID=61149 RepID=A0A2P2PAY7_RHIMU
MAPNMASSFLFFSSLTLLLFIATGQDRAPHGLAYESPVAFSPSAVEFFHPKTQEPAARNPCAPSSASNCSPLPVAAQVLASKAQESKAPTSQNGRNRLGASGIAGVVFGLAFVVLLAMGAYHFLITRRNNLNRGVSVQPDA